ncbi:MAG TPA: hypothetical protein DDZ90_12005 [Planctomycetaceae bacterium]|nr:hypothetical protein [Gimesia sp.]HBL44105.1 hypothetical protein [Planctomycetaceae bacterium]
MVGFLLYKTGNDFQLFPADKKDADQFRGRVEPDCDQRITDESRAQSTCNGSIATLTDKRFPSFS